VRALDKAGLGVTAPSVVGDYFPKSTPRQLAAKRDICSGAAPQTHSHFFSATGAFGSVDQAGNQVDDGAYIFINNHTIRIGPAGTFRFSVPSTMTLILHPVITTAQRRRALARPLVFSTAAWEIAVSYGGQPWRRVSCGQWC
jgi:hypothetical protein